MGIDFIERRSRGRSDGGGRVGANCSDSNGGVMASSSSSGKVVSGNGNHRYHQQQQVHHHNNSYHNHVVPDNGYHRNHNHTKERMVLVSEGSPKENGHYNHNQCSTIRTVATRTQVTSPSPSSAVVNPTTRSFLSYTSSPTLNGSRSNGGSGNNNYNHQRQRNNSSSHLSAVPPATTSSSSSVGTSVTDNTCAITPAAAIPTTPAKPSRTLSVRNFSNFVKRLPSLSLSPSVRIATSLGFSSTNSHNHSNNSESTNGNNASSSSSAKLKGLSTSGNTATLKRPTTVSFQKKKARPFSYAEPGSLSNGHHNHHATSSSHLHQLQKSNGISSSKKSSIINSCDSHFNSIPVTNLSPKGKLENVGNDGPTYNGHNVADLEARLAHLRVQQRERRKSLDFAISCVEPDPTCFSVEEQV